MPVNKLVISMALPLIVSNLVQALYNIVDSIFVAQINENATKAVSLAFPIQMLIIAVAVGTGVGTSSLMSRKLGEKNFKDAGTAANQGFFLAACGAILFLIFGLFFTDPFFTATTDNAEICSMGISYLKICCCASLGVFIQINCERILQGTGNATWSMILQIIGAVTNIILDPVLIFGWFGLPQLGVAGAAIATVCGQTLAAVLGIIIVIRKTKEFKISPRKMLPNGRMILTIYQVGFPSIIMQALNSVILTVINSLLMPVSELSVWIFGVYFKIQSFVFMPIFGLNNGIIPIIAYNYGARRKKRILDTMRVSFIFALSVMAAGTLLFWLIPELLLGMFNPTAETLRAGCSAFRIISISFLFSGVAIVCSGTFQALGKGFSSLLISAIRQALVLLPVFIALLYLVGPEAVYFSYPVAEFVAAVLSAIIMIRTYKKQIAHLPD
ncbi:MAG: MATE family efflux transporter [Oscillospiraceae bacterium]|nr:MATE family efflux transporter [Oscillospiraceae bacterium]